MKITHIGLRSMPVLAVLLATSVPAFAQTMSTASSTGMTSTSSTMTSASPTMTTGSMMSASFTIGTRSAAVTALQNYLIANGYSIPAGATGYYGAQTQAAFMMYKNAGNSSSSSMMVPTTSTKAADLRAAMHDILEEHISSSLSVLRAINDNNIKVEQGALAEQDANAVTLSTAIGSVYGTDAGTAFLALFRAHIKDSNAYTQGLKDGSIVNQQAALADLDMQLQKISSFLSGANPNIDNATLLSALRAHEDLINQSSKAYNSGDYMKAFSLETQALTQIAGGADYLSGAIVKQYPDKFRN